MYYDIVPTQIQAYRIKRKIDDEGWIHPEKVFLLYSEAWIEMQRLNAREGLRAVSNGDKGRREKAES